MTSTTALMIPVEGKGFTYPPKLTYLPFVSAWPGFHCRTGFQRPAVWSLHISWLQNALGQRPISPLPAILEATGLFKSCAVMESELVATNTNCSANGKGMKQIEFKKIDVFKLLEVVNKWNEQLYSAYWLIVIWDKNCCVGNWQSLTCKDDAWFYPSVLVFWQ